MHTSLAMLIIGIVAREAAIIESCSSLSLSIPGAGGSSFLSPSPSLPLWSGRERLILAAGLVKHGEVVTRNPYGRRH